MPITSGNPNRNKLFNVRTIIAITAGKKLADTERHPEDRKPFFIRNHDLNCTAPNFVELNCQAGGVPAPTITWYKKYEKLNDSNGKKWIMTLNLANSSSYGDFTCYVCNRVECVNHTYVIGNPGKIIE